MEKMISRRDQNNALWAETRHTEVEDVDDFIDKYIPKAQVLMDDERMRYLQEMALKHGCNGPCCVSIDGVEIGTYCPIESILANKAFDD